MGFEPMPVPTRDALWNRGRGNCRIMLVHWCSLVE